MMLRSLMRLVGAAALAASFTGLAPSAVAASLDTYGQLPSLENVAISPDGRRLALVTTINDQRRVLVSRIGDQTGQFGISAGKQKIRALQWAGPTNLLLTTSVTTTVMGLSGPSREYYLVQSFDVEKRKGVPFMEDVRGLQGTLRTLNVVFSQPTLRLVNGRQTAFVHGIYFPSSEGVRGLFRIDVLTGRSQLADPGSQFAYDWEVGGDGTPVARAEYDDKRRRWSLSTRGDNAVWTERYAVEASIERPVLIGLAPKADAVLVQETKDERYELTAVAIADGARLGPVGKSSYSDLVEDPATHRVIGGARIGSSVEYDFFDPADQATWQDIVAAFPGEEVRLESWSENRRRIVVRVDGPRAGAGFFLIDLDAKTAQLIGNLYDGLKAADIAPVRLITYKAADGLQIPAYLTLPRGREAKNLPLVVLAHGGPAARDLPEFDWWAQALAAQGYAVLQPQFRGSDGFGKAHLEAGYGEWGRKMQTDLSDGVRKLAKDGVIDPAKVCIVGASYGGYAALAGAAFDGDVYRCAASVAGPADLRKMLSREQEGQRSSDSRTLRYWTRFMGAETAKDPRLVEISPSEHVDRIRVPILLVHGRDDTVVRFEQSKLMDAALTKAGKPHSFVSLDGEDHWLSREPTRKQMLSAVVDFLKANNPPN